MNADDLMTQFADRTGLDSHLPSRRYLWTDAFAVCNFLGLARASRDARDAERHRASALRLVARVHRELGRHRTDDLRAGALSGLSDEAAENHPTQGGLRIGKPLPERAPGEPLDPDREWDRDGQYFHYLTKWMHALDQVARATGDAKYHRWACELFDVAHRAFTRGPEPARRMVWKLSVDLSRPLVPSMGQHDPLDGFVTAVQLEAGSRVNLGPAKVDYASMIDSSSLATSDPLGIGGLLFDAGRLVQSDTHRELASVLLAASAVGLVRWSRTGDLGAHASSRLAFRELGLAIGFAALPLLESARLDATGQRAVEAVARFAPLREEIVAFWQHDAHRRAATWIDHLDINEVMLATALEPEGFIELLPATPRTLSRASGSATASKTTPRP